MKKKILKISIIGRTNAGKSTLLNSLVGETLSITNRKINTTEDLILGVLNILNNQLIFYDTPGIHNLKNIYSNKKKLKQNLWEGLNNSDLIIYLIDLKKYKLNEIINNINKLNEINKEIIIVLNKNDLIKKIDVLPIIKEINQNTQIDNLFSISSKKKTGLKLLINYLITKTYFSNWLYNKNEISNKDDVYMSNEITRNEVLNFLHQEIPYNIKIINNVFKYLKNGDLKIKQEIQIENKRYKKIILGKNGSKIKEIRIKSQKNLSKIFNSKVHLYINLNILNAKEI